MRDYDFFKWRRDMLQHFQTLTSSEQIYKLLQQQTELLEYDYFSLCVRHPVPFTRPKVSIHTSYPERWINQYMAENFQAIDPVLKVENFCRGHLPWDDTLFRDATTLWEAARDNGVCKGVTQCLMLPNRAMGFFSVSRENTKAKNPCSDDEMELRLQTLVELSLLTLLRLDDDMVTPPEMRFSKRELEILKWTAEGKTSAEIAMILSISENTVNFHQKNMQKKFNAPNKTQIACYAAATGII